MEELDKIEILKDHFIRFLSTSSLKKKYGERYPEMLRIQRRMVLPFLPIPIIFFFWPYRSMISELLFPEPAPTELCYRWHTPTYQRKACVQSMAHGQNQRFGRADYEAIFRVCDEAMKEQSMLVEECCLYSEQMILKRIEDGEIYLDYPEHCEPIEPTD